MALSTKPPFPQIPAAPASYTQLAFQGWRNTLRACFELIEAVGAGFFTTINASSLPTTGYNQPNGTFFADTITGAVYVVQPNIAYMPSLLLTGLLGTVTVSPT